MRNDSWRSYEYIIMVLKGLFLQGETAIRSNRFFGKRYLNLGGVSDAEV